MWVIHSNWSVQSIWLEEISIESLVISIVYFLSDSFGETKKIWELRWIRGSLILMQCLTATSFPLDSSFQQTLSSAASNDLNGLDVPVLVCHLAQVLEAHRDFSISLDLDIAENIIECFAILLKLPMQLTGCNSVFSFSSIFVMTFENIYQGFLVMIRHYNL